MEKEVSESNHCCPSCRSEKPSNFARYKDIEDEGNYFIISWEYCPDCKYIYYSDVE